MMNYCRRLLIFSIFTCCMIASGDWAYGADLKTVVEALEQGYNSLTDMQAGFSQRTFISSVKREERGAGQVFIKKPSGATAMFRFDYTKPRQQIISNGKKVWYYLPENNQVMVGDMAEMFEGGKGVALNYLTGMGRLSKDFTIAFAGSGRDKNNNYVLELIPKKPSQVLAKLQLTVAAREVERFQEEGQAKAPFPVLSSVVHDQLGNRTTIEFSNVKANRGLGNDRFTFKIPAGTEVITNR